MQDLKVDLAGLQERLRAAKGLTEEMEASTESYKRIRKEIEDIDARNKELAESLEKLHAVEDAVMPGALSFCLSCVVACVWCGVSSPHLDAKFLLAADAAAIVVADFCGRYRCCCCCCCLCCCLWRCLFVSMALEVFLAFCSRPLCKMARVLFVLEGTALAVSESSC